MIKHGLFCVALLAAGIAPAWSEDPSPAAAYRAVMAAQYAARQAPLPPRAEEEQRIYDAYLRSIGKASKDTSKDSGSSAGMSSH